MRVFGGFNQELVGGLSNRIDAEMVSNKASEDVRDLYAESVPVLRMHSLLQGLQLFLCHFFRKWRYNGPRFRIRPCKIGNQCDNQKAGKDTRDHKRWRVGDRRTNI